MIIHQKLSPFALTGLFIFLPLAANAQGWNSESEEIKPDTPKAEFFRGALPNYIDLSSNLPIPRSQGPSNTCTSWAVTYAAASMAERTNRHAGQKDTTLSPAFTYNLVSGEPHCMGPTSISGTLNVLRDVGAVPFEEYVFDPGWCGRQPTYEERARAAAHRIKGWAIVDAADLIAVKSQLARATPVIFGMRVGRSFARFRGNLSFDIYESGPTTEGHAMVAIGYDDDRQAFRVQNSQGPEWGDGGRFWLSYRLWQLNVRSGFIIEQ